MIIKADIQEADMIEYCAAVFGLDCHKFTMENNPKLVQIEITHSNGDDIDSATAWLLCSSVQTKLSRIV